MQSLCGSGFALFAVRILAMPRGANLPTTLCKNKDGDIPLPSDLNAIIVITSYYCVILKMVTLHDAIKTILKGVFVFFFHKNANLFPLKKNKITDLKNRWFVVILKNDFFSTLIIFQSVFVIFT